MIALNWLVDGLLLLAAPIALAAADIALLRWLFLAPGMEKSLLHTIAWLSAMWFIGAQALAALLAFALGASVIITFTRSMRSRSKRG
jgi:hypothetical protein